mgnify:CR=1 FL=1
MAALPTVNKTESKPAVQPLSREAIRARASARLGELEAAKKPAEAPAEAKPAEEKKAAPAAMIEPGKPATDDKEVAKPPEEKPAVPSEEKKPEPPKPPDKPTSDEWVAFKRQQSTFKAEQEALKKDREDVAAARKAAAEDDALKKSDPYAWAEKHGLKLKDWNARALNNGNKTPEEIAKEIASAEVAAFKKEYEEERAKEREANQQREASAAMQRWDSELSTLVAKPSDGTGDKYPLTRIAGWQAMAKQIIFNQLQEDRSVYGQDAKPLTNEEALSRVESHLAKLKSSFLELDKATLPATQSPAQKQAPIVTQGGTAPPPRTLDPDSPASPPPNPEEEAGLSREEKKALRRKRLLVNQG